jgi:hypothetical protein
VPAVRGAPYRRRLIFSVGTFLFRPGGEAPRAAGEGAHHVEAAAALKLIPKGM